MEILASNIIDNNKSIFFKDVGKILAIQIIYQMILSLFFYIYPPGYGITPVLYFNYSAYFFIFVISASTLKYTVANKILVYLLVIEFLYFATNPLFLYVTHFYNIQTIITYSFILLVTLYLFFYSIAPNSKSPYKHFVSSFALTLIIISLTYSNVDIILDYGSLEYDEYWDALNKLNLNSYYVNLICLSFLLFVWFTYNQGHYLLSEFLPAILSIHTLMIINEVYQLYNFNHLINNFIDGQYFNAIINTGFIIIWFVRLNYLSNPSSKKGEHFVLNYDLLSGYVEKPHNELWDSILTKLGKQKLYIGSLLLFAIICIPLILVGDLSFFSRFNIILMLFFLVGVMIYAIVYTQRKWFNHIGFLIKEQKK